jgi:phosphohistidine phosphatase SixA
MKKFLYIFSLIVLFSCAEDNSPKILPIPEGKTPAKTTYYLIRHAEKDRTDPANKNPQLNAKGFERTKFWGDYFKDKGLQKFYTTDYMRTFQTLIPIVYPFKGEVEFYEAKDSLFTKAFWESTYGTNTIIVGHSNTTPKFVNQIIGKEKYEQIPDSINHRVYKVVIDETGLVAKDTFENVLIKSTN